MRGVTFALVGLWAVYFAYVLTGPGLGAEGFFRTYVFSGLPILAAVVCIVRAWCGGGERTAWALMGTGMILWGGGSIFWSVFLKHLEAPPYPSIADALYLGFYMRLVGRHSWVSTLGLSVSIPVLTFVIFERWFLVPLPKGPLEAWLGY